jgi:hypothetical protein
VSAARERQILACSGVLYPPENAPPELAGAQVRQAMGLAGERRPRVCLIPTGGGDSRETLDHWYGSAASFGAAELSHLQLFTQPNVADVREHLLAQDMIFVSGGSVVNLPGRTAWQVTPAAGDGFQETAIPARYWLPLP